MKPVIGGGLASAQPTRINPRALPTETKVESGTSQSKSGTSVKLSNSGISQDFRFRVEGAGLAAVLSKDRARDQIGGLGILEVPHYRGTSLIRNRLPLGPYSSIYLGSYGGLRGGAVSYGRGTHVHPKP